MSERLFALAMMCALVFVAAVLIADVFAIRRVMVQ